MKTILHVGCGRKRFDAPTLLGVVGLQLEDADGYRVVHLDADPQLTPDVVCRLGDDPIPMEDDSVDLVIAWHVLEHIGYQGDARAWFRAFEELYRVLTPNGLLYGESPSYDSIWAWSDPTHTRAISEHSFVFFMQDAYRQAGSIISPYRIQADFGWAGLPGMPQGHAIISAPGDARDRNVRFSMLARKPFRPWWED